MTLSTIIGLAAVFFIVGILCIVKGISAEEQDAVPISNPQEIKDLKSAFMPSKQKSEISTFSELTAGVPNRKLGKQARIDQLAAENNELKNAVDSQTEKLQQLEKDAEVLKADYNRIKNSKVEAVKTLQDKLVIAQQENERLLPNHQLIGELKSKSESLEKQYRENQAQAVKLKEFIVKLESERNDLLRLQKIKTDQSELEALNSRIENSIAAIEALKSENKDLQEMNQNLRSEFKKTEEFNVLLIQKEKKLEYELSKNRAQTLGLEKICEDFKLQIESMAAVASDQQHAQ